jgi:hypothetical protein
LLNFKEKITGGACTGGNSLKAYRFIHKYGLADDTCAPFMGINWLHGFEIADMYELEDVQSHQCFLCTWGGTCTFVPRYVTWKLLKLFTSLNLLYVSH